MLYTFKTEKILEKCRKRLPKLFLSIQFKKLICQFFLNFDKIFSKHFQIIQGHNHKMDLKRIGSKESYNGLKALNNLKIIIESVFK